MKKQRKLLWCHACTVAPGVSPRHALPPSCRYYSRGFFCSPVLTGLDGYPSKALGQKIKGTIWGLSTLLTSLFDWPLRRLTRGVVAGRTLPVRSATQTYDAKLAAELWDASAELAKLPARPDV